MKTETSYTRRRWPEIWPIMVIQSGFTTTTVLLAGMFMIDILPINMAFLIPYNISFSPVIHNVFLLASMIVMIIWCGVRFNDGPIHFSGHQFGERLIYGVPVFALLTFSPTTGTLTFIVATIIAMASIFSLIMHKSFAHGVSLGPGLLLASMFSPVFGFALPGLILTLPFLSPWRQSAGDITGFVVATLAPLVMGLIAAAYIFWLLKPGSVFVDLTFAPDGWINAAKLAVFIIIICPAFVCSLLSPFSCSSERTLAIIALWLIGTFVMVVSTTSFPPFASVVFAVTVQWAFVAAIAHSRQVHRTQNLHHAGLSPKPG